MAVKNRTKAVNVGEVNVLVTGFGVGAGTATASENYEVH